MIGRRLVFLAPRRDIVGLLGAFLKGGVGVQNPGAKGAQFHYSKAGKVEYGKEGSQIGGGGSAARPASGAKPMKPKPTSFSRPASPVRGAGRAEQRRGKTVPGPLHLAAFKQAYPLLREKAMSIIAAAKDFATNAKLKVMHAALKANHTWEKFEHHVKKLGGDAEELVTHTFIEMPELLEHVVHLMHDGGHALTHLAINHGAEAVQLAAHVMKSRQFSLFPGSKPSGKLGEGRAPHDDHAPGSRPDCPGCKEFREKQQSLPLGPDRARAAAEEGGRTMWPFEADEEGMRQARGRAEAQHARDAAARKTGEGSRGGQVVGRTKSGHAIYQPGTFHEAHGERAKAHLASIQNDKRDMQKDGAALEAAARAYAKSTHSIGVTRSGKPIYMAHDHPGHASFGNKDHMDAWDAHRKLAEAATHRGTKLYHMGTSMRHSSSAEDAEG